MNDQTSKDVVSLTERRKEKLTESQRPFIAGVTKITAQYINAIDIAIEDIDTCLTAYVEDQDGLANLQGQMAIACQGRGTTNKIICIIEDILPALTPKDMQRIQALKSYQKMSEHFKECYSQNSTCFSAELKLVKAPSSRYISKQTQPIKVQHQIVVELTFAPEL